MAFEDRNRTGEIKGPHPDLAKNIEFWHKLLGRVYWLTNTVDIEMNDREYVSVMNPETEKYEMAARIKEYKHANFIVREADSGNWPVAKIKTTLSISFHQENRKFREELAGIYNKLGEWKLLKHRLKHDNGDQRKMTLPGQKMTNKGWEEVPNSAMQAPPRNEWDSLFAR